MKSKYFRNAALLAATFVTVAVALPKLPQTPSTDRLFFLLQNLGQRVTALETQVAGLLGQGGSSVARLKQERVVLTTVGEQHTVRLPVADAPVLIVVSILQSSFVCEHDPRVTLLAPTLSGPVTAFLDSRSGMTQAQTGPLAPALALTGGICPQFNLPTNFHASIFAAATFGTPYINHGEPLTPDIYLQVIQPPLGLGVPVLNEPVTFVVNMWY
jgi:hypothetical protein